MEKPEIENIYFKNGVSINMNNTNMKYYTSLSRYSNKKENLHLSGCGMGVGGVWGWIVEMESFLSIIQKAFIANPSQQWLVSRRKQPKAFNYTCLMEQDRETQRRII